MDVVTLKLRSRGSVRYYVGWTHEATSFVQPLMVCLISLCVSGIVFGQEHSKPRFEIQLLNGQHTVDCIRVPIDFDSLSGDLVIDTGSDHSTVSLDYVDFCGRELSKAKANDVYGFTSSIRVFQNFPFRFRGNHMSLVPVGAVDLRGFQEAVGGPVVGIAGYDFITKNELCLGYDSSRSRFYISPNLVQSFDKLFPVFLSENDRPIVNAVVDDDLLSPSFLIDTGTNATFSISTSEYDRLKRSGRLSHERTSNGKSFFGSGNARRAVLDRVCVFERDFRNVPVIEEKGTQNRIGLGMLRRFDFLLNPISKSLAVSYPVNPEEKFTCDLSGIAVMQSGRSIVVRSVDTTLCLAGKDVRSGDILRSINGEVVSSLPQVRQLLSTYSPIPIKLTTQRKTVSYDVELELNKPETLGL